MAIVPVLTCKLHAHNYILKILGGGGPQTLLVNLFHLNFALMHFPTLCELPIYNKKLTLCELPIYNEKLV